MNYFAIMKRYYPRFYTKDDVKIFVSFGKITEEEYEVITGDVYVGGAV